SNAYECLYILFLLLMIPRLPTSTLFPYTTLFRSQCFAGPRRFCFQQLIEDGPDLFRVRPAPGLEFLRRREAHQLRQSRQRTAARDRKSTRLNSSHLGNSYAVFCLKKKKL